MRPAPRVPNTPPARVLLAVFAPALLLAWLAPTPAGGQSDNPLLNPEAAGPADREPPESGTRDNPADAPDTIEHLDLRALLLDERVLAGRIEDPVWAFEPQPGRRLVQVPIRIDAVDQWTRLDQPAVRLRGGRFVGWRIIVAEDDRASRGGRARDDRALDGSDPLLVERGLVAPPADDEATASPITREQQGVSVPEGAPRISRRVVLTPHGTVRWELDRVLAAAQVKSGDEPYLLRLRPDRLEELKPARPERIERRNDEDPRAWRQRQREAQMAYRDEQIAFRDLRTKVRELPDTFEAPMPARLWAVYDASEALRDLSMTGPEPLPWRIGYEQFEALREVAAMSIGDEPSYADDRRINQLAPIAADEPPYAHRLLALALSHAQMVGKAKPKDPLHRLVEQVIAGPDEAARRLMLRDLVTTVPPTPSTRMLLSDASGHLTPRMKLASLRGALGGMAERGGDEASSMQMGIVAAAEALADPQGPPAGGVLEAVNEALAPRPESYPAVIAGIDLTTLPEDRRDDAIAYLIRSAGTSPLSAAWLSGALLGSNDPAVVNRTLELLAAASPRSPMIAAVTDQLLAALFGPPTEQAQQTLDLTLEQRIALDAPSHPLFRSLNAGDRETRELAWRALPNFVVPQRSGGRRADDQPDSDPVDMILVSALGRADTPPQVVPFIEHLPDTARSTAALLRLVIQADQAASRRAAGALFGDETRRLDEALAALTPGERAVFAERLYQARVNHTPRVVGLMRASNGGGGLVRWFAEHVMAGDLPAAADWAKQARGDEALLRWAASDDAALAAGAVAALVAAAGGDTMTRERVIEDFAAADDRTAAGLTEKWAKTRRSIFRQRIKQAEGSYRLVLLVPGPDDEDDKSDPDQGPASMAEPTRDGEAPAAAMTRLVLGVTDLIADHDQVRLGNDALSVDVPEDQLAIRVTSLVGLARFDHASDLKLDRVSDPVDLLPQEDGSWRGRFTLPESSRQAELWLEPVESP